MEVLGWVIVIVILGGIIGIGTYIEAKKDGRGSLFR